MTAFGASTTSAERRLNDRYVNSYRTSTWEQLNVEDAPKDAMGVWLATCASKG
jgi:hypothetical protein